jgi:hypothetical protein
VRSPWSTSGSRCTRADRAAGVALFALGATAGALGRGIANERPPAIRTAPHFALLLYDEAPAAGVEEMRQWAVALRERGHYVTGEKLAPSGMIVGARETLPASHSLTGFFVVSAATVEEAESIARSSPHVRRGGRIVVQPIERT